MPTTMEQQAYACGVTVYKTLPSCHCYPSLVVVIGLAARKHRNWAN